MIYNLLIERVTDNKLIDIYKSNIFSRLYGERNINIENKNDEKDFDDMIYEMTQMAVLDKMYCYFVYSKAMGLMNCDHDGMIRKQSIYELLAHRIKDEQYKFVTFGCNNNIDIDSKDDDIKIQTHSIMDRTVSSEQDFYDITTPIFYDFRSIIARYLKKDTMSSDEFIKFVKNVIESDNELKKEISLNELNLILNELSISNMDEIYFISNMTPQKFRNKLINISYGLNREYLYKLYREIIKSINNHSKQKMETLNCNELIKLLLKIFHNEYGMNMNY
eukprot:359920_1